MHVLKFDVELHIVFAQEIKERAERDTCQLDGEADLTGLIQFNGLVFPAGFHPFAHYFNSFGLFLRLAGNVIQHPAFLTLPARLRAFLVRAAIAVGSYAQAGGGLFLCRQNKWLFYQEVRHASFSKI